MNKNSAPISFELSASDFKSIPSVSVGTGKSGGFAIRNHAVNLNGGFAIRNHAVSL